MSARLELIINLDAIADNWRLLQQRMPVGGECGAVVKANAYGLGMQPVCSALHQAGCKTYFVANVEEGVRLRQALPALAEANVYVLQGVDAGSERLCTQFRLRPVIVSPAMLERWYSYCRSDDAGARVFALKVNTGMNRLGLSLSELGEITQRYDTFLKAAQPLLISHLACADTPDHPLNTMQLARFSEAQSALLAIGAQTRCSLANSSGLFLPNSFHKDLSRPGAALYGINPTPGVANPMRRVVSLHLPVLQVHAGKQGDWVGYGGDTQLQRDSVLVTVAGGYADGLARALFPNMRGFADGTPVSVCGRISMDSVVFDVTDVVEPAAIKSVEVLGANISVDEQAKAAGTIGYEVLTGLGERLHRRYVGGEQ